MSRLEQAEQLISTLSAQAEERQKHRAELSRKLKELEARVVLNTILPEVRDHVRNAKWANKAATILSSRIPPLLRSLTASAKEASERLLNQNFKQRFREECDRLRAPKVDIVFPGRRGQAARRKSLTADHRLSDILSEGEQKVIALADFLAECSLRRTSAPIVLDDPVNSLDYRRLRDVVDRIVVLSEHNQVVVFTHNIWFAAELLSRFEKQRDDCVYYGVSEVAGRAGLVHKGSHPRWDTVNKTRGRINKLIQDASSTAGETQAALIERGYELIRAWCEVVVESELLAGVTQRYQPNVAMTQLAKIKADRLPDAIGVILPLFERACRMIGGHSQPLETLSIRPTLDELREDWKKLQDALEAYQGAGS